MSIPVQYLYLQQIIEENSYKRIAEIGVWKGAFSIHILNLCPRVEKVYSIDPYKKWKDSEYIDGKNSHKQSKFDRIYERVKRRLSAFGDRSVLIRDTSLSAAKQIQDGSLDLVWIDANHGYDWVKQDIDAWFPKVRDGGILSGDDYLNMWPGVINAVNEYCFIRDIIISIIPGGVWYFEKGKIYLHGGRK